MYSIPSAEILFKEISDLEYKLKKSVSNINFELKNRLYALQYGLYNLEITPPATDSSVNKRLIAYFNNQGITDTEIMKSEMKKYIQDIKSQLNCIN